MKPAGLVAIMLYPSLISSSGNRWLIKGLTSMLPEESTSSARDCAPSQLADQNRFPRSL
jgi:hypothetical protein